MMMYLAQEINNARHQHENSKLKEIITPEPLPSIMIYTIYNRSSMNTPSFAKVIEKIATNNKSL